MKRKSMNGIAQKIAVNALEMPAFKQSLETHKRAFGPLVEHVFEEDAPSLVHFVNALNKLSRGDAAGSHALLSALKKTADTEDDHAALLFFEGLAYETMRERQVALALYTEAVTHNDRCYLTRVKMAKLLHTSGNFSDAAENYRAALRCLEVFPYGDNVPTVTASVCMNLATCLAHMKDYDQALVWIEKSKQARLDLPGRDAIEGQILEAMKKSEAADCQSC